MSIWVWGAEDPAIVALGDHDIAKGTGHAHGDSVLAGLYAGGEVSGAAVHVYRDFCAVDPDSGGSALEAVGLELNFARVRLGSF